MRDAFEIIEDLKKAHHQELQKAREEEREYALAIVKKYEAMPFSPTTFSRIKASLATPDTITKETV
jgi:hypothetical protein